MCLHINNSKGYEKYEKNSTFFLSSIHPICHPLHSFFLKGPEYELFSECLPQYICVNNNNKFRCHYALIWGQLFELLLPLSWILGCCYFSRSTLLWSEDLHRVVLLSVSDPILISCEKSPDKFLGFWLSWHKFNLRQLKCTLGIKLRLK